MIIEILCLVLGISIGLIISNYFSPLMKVYERRFVNYQNYVDKIDEENRRLRQRLTARENRKAEAASEEQELMQIEELVSQIPDQEIEKNLEKFGLKGINASMAKPLIAEFLKSQIK